MADVHITGGRGGKGCCFGRVTTKECQCKAVALKAGDDMAGGGNTIGASVPVCDQC
ncbi:MAG: hypothetical protein NVSMB42_07670 [Herpetosiphon sp.]